MLDGRPACQLAAEAALILCSSEQLQFGVASYLEVMSRGPSIAFPDLRFNVSARCTDRPVRSATWRTTANPHKNDLVSGPHFTQVFPSFLAANHGRGRGRPNPRQLARKRLVSKFDSEIDEKDNSAFNLKPCF